jgi:hypothetical protein
MGVADSQDRSRDSTGQIIQQKHNDTESSCRHMVSTAGDCMKVIFQKLFCPV